MEYEKLFDEFLNVVEFTLIKHPDGKWSVNDNQGANLGGINSDRYSCAADIFDRMDIYIKDYYVDDLEDCLEAAGYNTIEWETYKQLADYARPLLPNNQFGCDILDMICGNPDKVDLNKCFYETAEEYWGDWYNIKNFSDFDEEEFSDGL